MRAGIFVLPEYQHHGLGSRLSAHCNAAADAVQAPTYVMAMPAALNVFLSGGFQILETVDTPLKEHGGPDTIARSYVLQRPVPRE